MSFKVKPLKKLGQYFLTDRVAVNKVVKSAEISDKDTVLEIGPGTGILTAEICKRARKVIAVEKDSRMVDFLKKELGDFKNLRIYKEDILSFSLKGFKQYKVVANLPFYLTNPVIRKFLESSNPPQDMTLVIQKELAQRICAKAPKMNLLAVSVQFYARVKIMSFIKKTSFSPKPKIDTAIIKIISHGERKNLDFNKKFFKIVKAGFSQPRKQLANNLSKELKLRKEEVLSLLLRNNIQPNKRPENLEIKEWVNLARNL